MPHPTRLLPLLCAVLLLAGCSAGAAALDSVPRDAQLLYTRHADSENGGGVTTDVWSNPHDTGFFVVGVTCTQGQIKGLALHTRDGREVAALGDIRQDGIYITDLAVDAAGDYVLYCRRYRNFYGEINVYFVPGVGYSTDDETL